MVVRKYVAALGVIALAAACGNNPSSSDAGAEGGIDGTASDGAVDGGFVYHGPAIGTNLSGMEWAAPGLRYGTSTLPNLNFTVPRKVDVAYLAASGFTKSRLPIQWELLQPMLKDTVASAAVQTAVGQPGAFDATYASYITDVLDAHAAAGIKAIIDLHNYCRYQDFVYQSDGSVKSFVVPSNPLLRPYTSDSSQVQVRICALAPGATLTPAHLADFWTRAAQKWKDHPGFGGYGLMNEPHELPAPGAIVSGGNEDLTIWPTFAQAAIDAIRAVDPVNPIYVGGNQWSSAMAIATQDPGFPLKGNNLIYEVHMYLDASSAGYAFDYDTEVAKGYSAGLGNVPIDQDTGVNRLKIATDWATANGVKLALTEIGMPIDDVRWQTMFERAVVFALQQGVEVYTWMGGAHWTIHNYALNQTAGFHQSKTLEPSVSGALKAAAGIPGATLYDDGPGWAPPSTPVTIHVYARGNVTSPIALTIASDKGGTLSKTQLTIPAGANGEDSFTYTPGAGDAIATLTYSAATNGQVPPPRKIYSLGDPVAYASTSLTDAARAILAKYAAAQWIMADGYTDYMLGAPAADGQTVRAISDSGFGSSEGNALEMLEWTNKDNAASGTMVVPIMRTSGAGKRYADMRAADTFGFWCKKSVPIPNVQANPRNRVPYGVDDAHFAIAAISVPSSTNDGVVFQGAKSDDIRISELSLAAGHPQARWIDANNQTVQLTASAALPANVPAVIALTSTAGAQSLRVNGQPLASGAATFAPSVLDSLLIGSGFVSYYPRGGFGGDVYAVVAGKGAPTAAELQVVERYLAATAGLTL
jgi:endoglucanase